MFEVGSWQYYTLTVGIVFVLFVVCHYWDKYDKYKQRKLQIGHTDKVTLEP
jgi:hypothetical protein